MAEGGIFIDILARANMASFAKVFSDVQRMSREAGVRASKDFAEGTSGMFGSMNAEADAAFREMQVSLGQLQVAEARINAARLENFAALNSKMVAGRRTAVDSMIAMQKELDAAIANSQRLAEAAAAKAAEPAVIGNFRGSGADEPRGNGSVGRTANIVGGTSALVGAGALAEGVKGAADVQQNLQRMITLHQETQAGVAQMTQQVYRMSSQVPYSPQDLSKALQLVENAGYRGDAAMKVLETSAKTAVASGGDLTTTIEGLTTTLNDFGVKGEALANPAKFLEDMNVHAGQLIVTLGNIKNVDPDQFFHALNAVEPTAQMYMKNLNPNESSAQVAAGLAVLTQTGIGPEQAGHNYSRLISTFGGAGSKNSNIYNMLQQLGLKPEDIAKQTQDQGILPVLKTVGDVINAKAAANGGLVDIGWRYNPTQLKDIINQDISGLSPQAQAYLAAHPGINEGTSSPMGLRKELAKAGLSGNDTQDILALAGWQRTAHAPNKFTKSGGSTELTEAQVYQLMYGTGDIARTGLILGQNPQGNLDMSNQILQGGTSKGLQDAFNQAMGTTTEQWKQFTSNLKAIVAELGNDLLPTLTRWTHDVNSFLSQYGSAAKGILEGMAAVGGIWLAWKATMGAVALGKAVGDLASGALDAASAIKNGMPNWGIVRTGAEGLATAETAAGTTLTTGATTAAGSLKAGAATAGSEIAAGGSKFAAAIAGIPAMLPGLIAAWLSKQDLDKARAYFYSKDTPQQQSVLDNINAGKNFKLPDDPNFYKPQGKAKGGIVGYSGGTWHAGEQPLMDQPDMGGDSILGAINGMPIGLRGGEGILTPEAVARLGGKRGIDALNAGGDKLDKHLGLKEDEDPWANPFKVGTTFFGSFAEGVAKYSPWGKFLTGPAHTLKALEEQSEKAQGMNEEGFRPSEKLLEQQMLMSMSPEQLAAAGITRTKHGGWKLPDGSTISSTPGGTNGIQSWLRKSLIASGLSPDEARGILAMNRVEGGANDPMSILGFTEGQASGPGGHLQAFLGQWNDPSRRGDRGSIPGVGQDGKVTDWNAYMTWIRTKIVGQNGVSSDWQGNAQPPASVYQGNLMNALGKDDPKSSWFGAGFSRGGIVGYDRGGVVGPTVEDDTGKIIQHGRKHGDIDNPLMPWSDLPMKQRGQDNDRWIGGGFGRFPDGVGHSEWGESIVTPWGIAMPAGYSGGGIAGIFGNGGAPEAPPPPPPAPKPSGPQFDPTMGGLAPWDKAVASPPPKKSAATMPTAPQDTRIGSGQAKGSTPFAPPQQGGKPLAGMVTPEGEFPNPMDAEKSRNAMENPSRAYGQDNPSKGFGISGGLIGTAESAAAAAASMTPAGPAGSAAANMGFQLANRAIGYAGQLVGIGISGVMETLLPNNSPLADPGNNIFGKMAMGISGMHPTKMAPSLSQSASALNPKQDLDQGAQVGSMLPQVHMPNATINNYSKDHGETTQAMTRALNQVNGGLPMGMGGYGG